MKILVVYATKSGMTTPVAGWIADAIRDAGHDVTLARAEDSPSPDDASIVFAGSGIRAGNWHPAAVTWLRENADALRARALVTFTSSLAGADPRPETVAEVRGYTTKVLEPFGLAPVAHGILAGAYDPAKVSMPERVIMRIIRKGTPVDNRDEATVRAWAVHALGAARARG